MNIIQSQRQEQRLRASALGRLAEAAVYAAHNGCLLVSQLRSATRTQEAVAATRQKGMYLAHVGLGLTLTDVGLSFGRDRTTVRHACNLAEDYRSCARDDLSLAALECGLVAQALALNLINRRRAG
jgi:Bacterial dnaA protein helix-turn-helix